MEKRLLLHTVGELCNGSTRDLGQSDERILIFFPRRNRIRRPRKRRIPRTRTANLDAATAAAAARLTRLGSQSQRPLQETAGALARPTATGAERTNSHSPPPATAKPGARKPPATYFPEHGVGVRERDRASWRTRKVGDRELERIQEGGKGRVGGQASWIGELVKSRYGKAEPPKRSA